MNIIFNLNVFIVNLIFNNFFITKIIGNDLEVAKQNFLNIQKDFSSIGFPLNFKITSFFISLNLSILLTFLLFKLLKRITIVNAPIEILLNFFQLFFTYTGTLFSFLYIFRIYNLTRAYILLAIILYPLISYPIFYFLKINRIKNFNFNNYLKFSIFILLTIFLSTFYFAREYSTELQIDAVIETTSTTTTTIPVISNNGFELGVVNIECATWVGSNNYSGCLNGAEVISSKLFSDSLNNVIAKKNDVFVLDVFGKIFKNEAEIIFLDISEKVLNRIDFKGDSGLFSLAFHPVEDFLLISYSDLENNLVIEKYLLDSEGYPIINSSSIIYKIPNSNCCHYSGNLLWSDYFNDFILSVGDMNHSASYLENSDPLDTSSPIGKILLLNSNISNPPHITSLKENIPLRNIIAYGVRNPWKTYIYKNLLFVTDVGLALEEEMTMLNMDKFMINGNPFLLGWPHFEGTLNNEIIYNKVLLHKNNSSENINNFVRENTIFPNIYYSHYAPDNSRAAIIGGGVIEDINSKYYEHYFFADYLSGELFSYDFNSDKLKIIPIGSSNSFITSLTIHPYKLDTILITTGSGYLVEIKLP